MDLHVVHLCRILCPWNFSRKDTGVGCQCLLQGILLTQGSKLHLLNWQMDSFTMEPPGKVFGIWIQTDAHGELLRGGPQRKWKSTGFLPRVASCLKWRQALGWPRRSNRWYSSLLLGTVLRFFSCLTGISGCITTIQRMKEVSWTWKIDKEMLIQKWRFLEIVSWSTLLSAISASNPHRKIHDEWRKDRKMG